MLSSNNSLFSSNAYDSLLQKVNSIIALLEDYTNHSTTENKTITNALAELRDGLEIVTKKNTQKKEKYLRLIINEINDRIQQSNGTEETQALCAEIKDILYGKITHAPFTPPKKTLALGDIEWTDINRICFRGDDRDPDILFNTGFIPREPEEVIIDPPLVSHDGVVQCTSRFAAALCFPLNNVIDTWVYIFKLEKGFNVHMHGYEAHADSNTNLVMLDLNSAYKMYVHELITDSIPPENIIAAVQVKRYARQNYLDICALDNLLANVGSYQIVGYRLNHHCQVSDADRRLALEFIENEMIANQSNTYVPLPSSGYRYNFNFDQIKDTAEVSQRTVTGKLEVNTSDNGTDLNQLTINEIVLFRSIPRYDLATITECLERGANINAVDNRGHTPLFAAIVGALNKTSVDKADIKLITYLLDHNANVHMRNCNDQTLMFVIAHHMKSIKLKDNYNLLQLLKKLVEKGADLFEEIMPHMTVVEVLENKLTATELGELFPYYIEEHREVTIPNPKQQIDIKLQRKRFGGFFMEYSSRTITTEYNGDSKEKSDSKSHPPKNDDSYFSENPMPLPSTSQNSQAYFEFCERQMLAMISRYREEGVNPTATLEKIQFYMTTDNLMKKAGESEEVALIVLLTPALIERCGTDDIVLWYLGTKHEKAALLIVNTTELREKCSYFTLNELKEAHPSVQELLSQNARYTP
jgi:hypothetical protein